MYRYTYHRGTQHAAVKNVAGLEHLQDFAVFCVIRFGAVHGLVQVRIETLAERLNALHAKLGKVVQELLVDQLETLAIIFVSGFAVRG